jgi:hypothetical protein
MVETPSPRWRRPGGPAGYRRGAVADVYRFGGGAIVVGFDARGATEDLDARFTSTSTVIGEVQGVAAELGLPRWWLNEQATPYLPRQADPYPVPVFDHPNLRVLRASDRYLLAMKAAASRRNTRDMEDVAVLARHLGLQTVEEVVRVHDEVFGAGLSRAKFAIIREALAPATFRSVDGRQDPVHCRVCGRLLRSPTSRAAGIGPICATRGIA